MILSGVITNLFHLIICPCHFLVVHRLPIDTIRKPGVREQVGKMLQVVYTYIPPRASVLKVKSIWNEKKAVHEDDRKTWSKRKSAISISSELIPKGVLCFQSI